MRKIKCIAARVLAVSLAMVGAPAMAQTYTRTDTQTYEDNLGLWVLGQPKKSTVDTFVESEVDYDAATALPIRTYKFGKLQQTLTYAPDGTVATVSDDRDSPTFNTTVTLSGWKRGLPQRIDFPDGNYKTLWIDDYGLIRHVIDENGYKTCYEYDVMGRVNKITYPSETLPGVCDTSKWAATTITFDDGYLAAYGMPAGHWRQTTLTGAGRKVLVFDALWRPVVEQHLDLGNTAETLRETIRRYDHDGRVVFESYPMNTAGSAIYNDMTLKGTRTTFDALGRPTRMEQDAEAPLNLLVSTTEYLSGFQTKTTNPRGKVTTTSYYAWDTPTTDFPRDIVQQGDVITNITRDVLGKTTTITRRNAASTQWQRRYWTYNSEQELCKRMETETGTTLMHYDAAGNLDWSAAGLPWSDPIRCDDVTAPVSEKVVRTYDKRNRPATVAFPDGKGNTTYGYFPDGQLASLVADNGDGTIVTNTYDYNRRRLLTNEVLRWGPVNWGVAYDYNANGHLTTQSWHGLTVDYAPNAVGQPTKAGPYASNIKYYPNGAMDTFTFGNGIVHQLTQNVRGLPDLSHDFYGAQSFLKDAYDYDANGNVAAISDGLLSAQGNRTMVYDDLDRLASATSPMFKGTITYTYDAADKMLTQVAPGLNRDWRYCYDSSSNSILQFIRGNSTNCSNGAAEIAFEYSLQGNLTGKNNVGYDFDKGNRLRGVSASGTTNALYRYDGHGRRVWDYTTEDMYSHYSLDGRLLMAVDERKQKVSDYVQLNGSLLAIRERDVPTGIYTTKYQHTDALGTPVAVTDPSRGIAERSEYEPYGALLNRPIHDGPGFTGHVEDAATGLTYMQQRYYDSEIGRFLSVDQVTADSNTGGNFNRYWYANNNPHRFTDPDGREAADRAYGAVVGYMLRNDPERLRIWAGGEAAATTEGSAAEQGAAMGEAVGEFADAGDFSGEAVGGAALKVAMAAATRGKGKSKGGGAEHTKNARPSTKGKHEAGKARKKQDRGGEKGDKERRVPRKPPPNHKGPWPPKDDKKK